MGGARARRASFVWATMLLVGGLAGAWPGTAAAQDLGGGGIVIVGVDLSGRWDFDMTVLSSSDPAMIGRTFAGSFTVTGGVPTYSGAGSFNGRPATISGTGALDPTDPMTITLSDHIATTDSETRFIVTLMSGDRGTGTFEGGTLDGLQTWSGVFKIAITRPSTQTPAEQVESVFRTARAEMLDIEGVGVRGFYSLVCEAAVSMSTSASSERVRAVTADAAARLSVLLGTNVSALRAAFERARVEFQRVLASAPQSDGLILARAIEKRTSELRNRVALSSAFLDGARGREQGFLQQFAGIWARMVRARSSTEVLRLYDVDFDAEGKHAEDEKHRLFDIAGDTLSTMELSDEDDRTNAKRRLNKLRQILDKLIQEAVDFAKWKSSLSMANPAEELVDFGTEIGKIFAYLDLRIKQILKDPCALLGNIVKVDSQFDLKEGKLTLKVTCAFRVSDHPEHFPVSTDLIFDVSITADGELAGSRRVLGAETSDDSKDGEEESSEATVDLNEASTAAILAATNVTVKTHVHLDPSKCGIGTLDRDLMIDVVNYEVTQTGLGEGKYAKGCFVTNPDSKEPALK